MFRLVRPLVAQIDGTGRIERVEGGHGSFLGLTAADFEGTSVFDHVTRAEGDRLADYFISSAGGSVDSVTTPMPFRIELLGADGHPHPVDLIPTAYEEDGEPRGWIVVVVPVALTTAVSRALEAEMAGASRSRVRQLLTDELVTEGTGWLLLDRKGGGVITVTSSEGLDMLATTVLADVNGGWRPCDDIEPGITAAPLNLDAVPSATRAALDQLEFSRLAAAPVYANGKIIATYLHVATATMFNDPTAFKNNVMDRIDKLVDVTSLVLTRWHDQDELTALARSDSLTGLANRQAFSEALADHSGESALIYVDVDSFKHVNDSLGHQAGDHVLKAVADRIVSACRPTDVVARLGGDEFAVVLDQVDMATARVIGERIVESVRAPMPVEGCDRVTVSVGLAGLDDDTKSIDDADQAMLRAKRTGRDRLVVA